MKKSLPHTGRALLVPVCLLLLAQAALAQWPRDTAGGQGTAAADDLPPPPVPLPNYAGGAQGNGAAAHDGKLRWAVGVQNVQVIRSAPDNPSLTDGYNTIYRHHPFIAYWSGRFWVMHDGAHSRLAWSTNGLDWSPAESGEIFHDASTHRMGFYVASNGRFLASHWIGTGTGNPGTRLIREIYAPNSYGPEYNIKTNYTGIYPNKTWPYYTASGDTRFKEACNGLRGDPLYVEQWQEEDYQDPNSYTMGDGITQRKAFNWYRLPDNRIVGTWKGISQTLSTGSDWTRDNVPPPVKVTSFGYTPNAKTWGARTEDGRYAMVGCVPGGDLSRRWPLAVTTGSNGMTFNTPHLVIAGDIPPQRYENASGDDKNSGPQYVRGICPGNGDPPGTDLWLTYSMNKEDIWVARVPTPIQEQVTSDVHDDFQSHAAGRLVQGWNTYSPQWAPVAIAAEGANRFVRLEDRDPVDYAAVVRVFPQSAFAHLAFQVRAFQTNATSTPLEIDVVSSNGTRAVAISLNPTSGQITAWNGSTLQDVHAYATNQWLWVEILIDAISGRYHLRVNGTPALTNGEFLESAATVERIVFRTGAIRLRDFTRRPYVDGTWLTDRIPNADVLKVTSRFDIDAVALEKRNPLITSIDRVSTDRTYRRWLAAPGGLIYIDRTYSFQTLPAELDGLETIVTSNEDDSVTTSDHLRFTLSQTATVYLALDARATRLPAWASGWADTGWQIQSDSAGTFRVYSKPYGQGQANLGGNDRSYTGAASSYFVLAKPDLAAVTPATNLALMAVGPGRFRLSGQGGTNQTYGIYAQTDVMSPLTNWWRIGSTNADTSGLIQFLDTQATNTQRFYRFGP